MIQLINISSILNREIGNDSLFIENREMPYHGMYSVEKTHKN